MTLSLADQGWVSSGGLVRRLRGRRRGRPRRADELGQERSAHGSEPTHWRTATSGRTSSTRCAARSDMRRPRHEGQKPRRLHENATSSSWPPRRQARRTTPCSSRPQASTPRSRARRSAATQASARVRGRGGRCPRDGGARSRPPARGRADRRSRRPLRPRTVIERAPQRLRGRPLWVRAARRALRGITPTRAAAPAPRRGADRPRASRPCPPRRGRRGSRS